MITDERLHALAAALGLWPGTGWLLTALPAWLVPPLLSYLPLGLWLAAKMFVELRLPQLAKQYKGLWPGDLFLGVGLWALITGTVFHIKPETISPFWRGPWWNAATALLIVVVVFGLAIPEYVLAIINRHTPKRGVYTLYQLHTPTCLVHRVAMAAAAYVLMKLGIIAFVTGSVPWWLKTLGALGLVGWMFCAWYLDNTRPRPADLGVVHPRSKAWFRLV